ncbi:MAG: diacylglycerol kinase [Fusobacteriaceae bacterium]
MKKKKVTAKEHDIIQGFNYAIDGIFEAIRSERHMKFHTFISVVVVIIAIFSEISKYQILALILSITMVWVAELFNSSIEAVVDMVTSEYHPLAKRAKDMAAGAVLLTGINALIVAYIIFQRKISFYLNGSFVLLKKSFQNSLVIIGVIIIVLVILIKKYYRKGSPLKGGLPSGHSALGGMAFVAITFLTNNSKIFYLSIILLVLVMQSRVEGKIHNIKEVILGAILGIGVTYLILAALGF